jgi:plastocyanin
MRVGGFGTKRLPVRPGGSMLTILALQAALGLVVPRGAAAAPVTHYVVIEQMRFNPPTLTVRRGDRIQWVNKDLVAHTASSNAPMFDSGGIAPGVSWGYVASRPGSYPYRCNFHPTMRGTLNVR